MKAAQLILASTSAYRRELLGRFQLAFDVDKPHTDETPYVGEHPSALAARLALAKATAVAERHPEAWVIGSDQAAEMDGQALGKPGDRHTAREQLSRMAGCEIHFHTAVVVARHGHTPLTALDTTRVRFRQLRADEIERYVDAELPLDCAGSFKSEGLGISLFDAIHSEDPTALIGLPLIATARLLRQAGFTLP